MLTERIFAIAQVADQVVIWILLMLSVISVGMILERFFSLRTVFFLIDVFARVRIFPVDL